MKKYIFILLSIITLSLHAENKRFSIKGKLGDEISFRLDLEEVEYHGFVIGETTYYRKNGKVSKIKVYGNGEHTEYDGSNYHSLTLTEYNGTKVCGVFYVLFDEDGNFDNGRWVWNDKSYEMNEIENLPTNNMKTYVKPVDLEKATGVYEFSFVTNNGDERGGTLELYSERKNLAYHICQVNPNIAETQNTTSEFFQNFSYLTVANCHYMMSSYEGVVFVKANNYNSEPCEEFGAYSDIVGEYIATGKAPTGDILNSFQEERAFSEKLPCSVFELNEAWEKAVEGETTFPDVVLLKDIDGDGNNELIARYIEGKTERYEVSDNRSAVFTVSGGELIPVAIATNDLESIEIADGYVVKVKRNERGSRTTHQFLKLTNSSADSEASMTEAEINNFTIGGKTVKEKDFKKQIKIKNRKKIEDIDGWMTLPGNEKRNENAARG